MRRPEASVSTVSARNSLAVSIESIASNQYLLDLFVSEWQNVGVFDLCGLDGFGGVFLNPIGIEAELKEAVQSFQGLRGCSGVQLPCGTEVLQWVNVKLPQEHQAMVLTERCQGAVQRSYYRSVDFLRPRALASAANFLTASSTVTGAPLPGMLVASIFRARNWATCQSAGPIGLCNRFLPILQSNHMGHPHFL